MDVSQGCGTMHNCVLDNSYSLPNTIWLVTESISTRWTGNLALSGGKGKRMQSFRWEKLKGRNCFEDHGEDVKIIFICILKN